MSFHHGQYITNKAHQPPSLPSEVIYSCWLRPGSPFSLLFAHPVSVFFFPLQLVSQMLLSIMFSQCFCCSLWQSDVYFSIPIYCDVATLKHSLLWISTNTTQSDWKLLLNLIILQRTELLNIWQLQSTTVRCLLLIKIKKTEIKKRFSPFFATKCKRLHRDINLWYFLLFVRLNSVFSLCSMFDKSYIEKGLKHTELILKISDYRCILQLYVEFLCRMTWAVTHDYCDLFLAEL